MSAFQLFSICFLESEAALPELGHHTGKDREQFIRLAQEESDLFADNNAIVSEQLQPQLGFVRLLEQAIELRAEFGIRSRS
jgi:hypothetical protein